MVDSTAPKQWGLTSSETVASFESWRQNLLYRLSLQSVFKPFLEPNVCWQKKTKSAPLRGLQDDDESIPECSRRTSIQKSASLDLVLGQIANFCTVIARDTIVKKSTCLDDVWQAIRAHFGFDFSGAHFLDLNQVRLEDCERPEDLFQRLTAFIDDNLLKSSGNITHHSEAVTEDEETTPTVENMIVFWWLKSIHKDLPSLVKQRYATDLRLKTLASIKPEISMALDSLLAELQSLEDARVFRSASNNTWRRSTLENKTSRPQQRLAPPPMKSCPICKHSGRHQISHFLSKCPFLPEADRRFLARARLWSAPEEGDLELPDDVSDPTAYF